VPRFESGRICYGTGYSDLPNHNLVLRVGIYLPLLGLHIAASRRMIERSRARFGVKAGSSALVGSISSASASPKFGNSDDVHSLMVFSDSLSTNHPYSAWIK